MKNDWYKYLEELLEKARKQKNDSKDFERVKTLEEYGTLFSIEEFISSVKCGALIDYDGYGHFAVPGEEEVWYDYDVFPSLVDTEEFIGLSKEFTHILWFNR